MVYLKAIGLLSELYSGWFYWVICPESGPKSIFEKPGSTKKIKNPEEPCF